MQQVVLDNLTEYEARALLMYVEVQNDGALFNEPEKISAVPAKQEGDFYSLAIECPDSFPSHIFESELNDVRNFGYSMLDPEKVRVNTARTELPALEI